jgi:hypothetical protein
MVEGFQLHLGGHLGTRSRLGRKSRGLKVTADGAADYIVGLLGAYTRHRADGESFADWVAGADEAVLAAPAAHNGSTHTGSTHTGSTHTGSTHTGSIHTGTSPAPVGRSAEARVSHTGPAGSAGVGPAGTESVGAAGVAGVAGAAGVADAAGATATVGSADVTG